MLASIALAALALASAGASAQTPSATSSTTPDAATSPEPTGTVRPDFDAWLVELRRDALAGGIDPLTVERALGRIEQQPVVIERDRAQAEFTLTLPQYLQRRLSKPLVTLAVKQSAANRALLTKVQRAYDVPRSILVAIWGLESNFGRFSGVRATVPVLATLAYEGRRADLFRRELLDALRIVDRGDVDLASLQGSWAGAMGQPQFLPSSYLQFAQDFDEDGRRNIWSSLPDVFASIAFYMKSKGWTAGESWGRRVRVPPAVVARLPTVAPLRTTGCRAIRALSEPRPLTKWQSLGVRTPTGARLPKASLEASLLQADGEAFLVYRNYETILAYNCAHTYALSVALLSDRIDGKTSSWIPAPAPKKAARPRR